MWAAALALHHTARRLDSGAIPGKTLADYSYSESEINDLILNEARSLKFRGVSVRDYREPRTRIHSTGIEYKARGLLRRVLLYMFYPNVHCFLLTGSCEIQSVWRQGTIYTVFPIQM